MKKWCRGLSVFLLLLILVGCAKTKQNKISSMSWQQAMRYAIGRYQSESEHKLAPYFKKAGLKFPPKALTFLVFKQSRQFEIYAKQNGGWHYIRTFPILAASGGFGPKLHQGDRQVPEGIYQIIGMNPKSRFDLSMHLNYPNQFDRTEAKKDHRTHLGNNIYIHGRRRSIGCIALGDDAIQQLFPLVQKVGIHHAKVIIAPDDLRVKKPVYSSVHPRWLKTLYRKMKRVLINYPIPA